MKYQSHSEIPIQYRKIILSAVSEKRVNKVDIIKCNDIIEEHDRHEAQMAPLRKFQITYQKGKTRKVYDYNNASDALTTLDQLIGFDERDPDVLAVVKQGDRIVRGYFKGEWYIPEPRDAIKYVNRV
tara:strand:- start:7634 stop:8014 length:381 start_codon:yes stop_codon:yes gene_type:complete